MNQVCFGKLKNFENFKCAILMPKSMLVMVVRDENAMMTTLGIDDAFGQLSHQHPLFWFMKLGTKIQKMSTISNN